MKHFLVMTALLHYAANRGTVSLVPRCFLLNRPIQLGSISNDGTDLSISIYRKKV